LGRDNPKKKKTLWKRQEQRQEAYAQQKKKENPGLNIAGKGSFPKPRSKEKR